MKTLVCKKPKNAAVRGPIILSYLVGKEGAKEKITRKVNFGETFEEKDQIAYELCAKYPGVLTIRDSGASHSEAEEESDEKKSVGRRRAIQGAPSNRMLKDEAVK